MTKAEMIAAAREVVLEAWKNVLAGNSHDLRLIEESRWNGAIDVLEAIGGCDLPGKDAVPGVISCETSYTKENR